MEFDGTEYNLDKFTPEDFKEPEREAEFKDLLEYIKHDSWRCTHPAYKDDPCDCGLDALTDELGLPRVERY